MSTIKKNYPIQVHALHSRLQLVRDKLDIHPRMTPDDVVTRNLRYFEKAGESVKIYHEHRCGRTEFHQAAELLILSLNPDEKRILTQPIWRK